MKSADATDFSGNSLKFGFKAPIRSVKLRNPAATSVHRPTPYNIENWNSNEEFPLRLHGIENVTLAPLAINVVIGTMHPGYVVEFQHSITCLNSNLEYIELSGDAHLDLFAAQLAGNSMSRKRALKSNIFSPDFEEHCKEARALHEIFNSSLEIVAHRPKTAYHHLVPSVKFSILRDRSKTDNAEASYTSAVFKKLWDKAYHRVEESVSPAPVWYATEEEIALDHKLLQDYQKTFPAKYDSAFDTSQMDEVLVPSGKRYTFPRMRPYHPMQLLFGASIPYSRVVTTFAYRAEMIKFHCSSEARRMGPDPNSTWVTYKWHFTVMVTLYGPRCLLTGQTYVIGVLGHPMTLSEGKISHEMSMVLGLPEVPVGGSFPADITIKEIVDMMNGGGNVRCESSISNRFHFTWTHGHELTTAMEVLTTYSQPKDSDSSSLAPYSTSSKDSDSSSLVLSSASPSEVLGLGSGPTVPTTPHSGANTLEDLSQVTANPTMEVDEPTNDSAEESDLEVEDEDSDLESVSGSDFSNENDMPDDSESNDGESSAAESELEDDKYLLEDDELLDLQPIPTSRFGFDSRKNREVMDLDEDFFQLDGDLDEEQMRTDALAENPNMDAKEVQLKIIFQKRLANMRLSLEAFRLGTSAPSLGNDSTGLDLLSVGDHEKSLSGAQNPLRHFFDDHPRLNDLDSHEAAEV